jgi:hypothetical protein
MRRSPGFGIGPSFGADGGFVAVRSDMACCGGRVSAAEPVQQRTAARSATQRTGTNCLPLASIFRREPLGADSRVAAEKDSGAPTTDEQLLVFSMAADTQARLGLGCSKK